MDRLVRSRNLITWSATAAAGLALHVYVPFAHQNEYLQLMWLKNPVLYRSLATTHAVLLFSTPFFLMSAALELLFRLRPAMLAVAIESGRTPPYPDPRHREKLFVVLGEKHHPIKPIAAANPTWTTIGEKGLYCGTFIVGAVGSGKTSMAILPYAGQLLAYKAHDPEQRIGGLGLEVKGGLCHDIQKIMRACGRGDDYRELGLGGEWCWNPLYNDVGAYAQAYNIASLLNNLFGKGKEPFWQLAYTNLVKFIVLLHQVLYDYVTLADVYDCAIDPKLLEKRLQEGAERFEGREYVLIAPEALEDEAVARKLKPYAFAFNEETAMLRATASRDLRAALEFGKEPIPYELARDEPAETDDHKRHQFDAIRKWFTKDWSAIKPELRTSIVEGISVFLSLFDDDPTVKRIFCPPKEAYDPKLNTVDENGRYKYGRTLPPFSEMIEQGTFLALNLPFGANAAFARAIGTMLKLDFQRAVIMRVPRMRAAPDRHYRPVIFLCDEYQAFATCGENDPNGDEKFFSLSREPKCIALVATQSNSSLKSTLPGNSFKTLLQTFRTRIFLTITDPDTQKEAEELVGKDDKVVVSYNLSENVQDAKVSAVNGRTHGERSSVTASKSYSLRLEPRFAAKVFGQLKNGQAIVLAFDGFQPLEPARLYLKPHYLDPNVTWFEQVRRGDLQ